MRTIHKFPIEGNPFKEDIVEIPHGFQVLKVDVDHTNGKPCFWAFVDTDQALINVTFVTRMTGQDLGTLRDYVGSFQQLDGWGNNFVGHLFKAG